MADNTPISEQTTLEQYKVYNESVNRLNGSWSQTDKLYLSILTGLSAAMALLIGVEKTSVNLHLITIAIKIIAGLATILSASWYLNIVSYTKIRTRKFEILKELEKSLPHQCFTNEFALGEGIYRNPYLPNLDNFVAIFILLFSLGIMIFPIQNLFIG